MFLKKKILVVSSVIAILFLFFFQYVNRDKTQLPDIGGDFKLINQNGVEVNNDSFSGRKRLVFFGFTNCPDFCPDTLNDIGIVLEKINKKNNLIPIFITVDPERDTVKRLKEYLSNFHPEIVGLTGTKEQIGEIKKKYKIFAKKIMHNKNKSDHHDSHDHGAYAVDHTTIIYLMDEKGKYLKHFNADVNNASMIKKINEYL